jgi:DNA-nicking Smr family endonuclease
MVKHSGVKPDGVSDGEVFRAAMQDVRPLPPGKSRVTPKPAPRTSPRKLAQRRAATAAAAAAELSAALPLVSSESGAGIAPEETLSYRRPGVREQLMRRLRRGLVPREAELDLHGMSQASARDLTVEFLDGARAAGMRCVRIIHGKGLRSAGRGAVLKSALNEWLRRHPDVMAFTSARPIDGGAGAAYVLLRA